MKGVAKIGCLALAAVLASAMCAEAQPQGRDRSPAQRAAMRVRGQLPVEQVIGFLAFDEKMGVTDDQLLKVRRELKAFYEKRADYAKKIVQEMEGAEDRQSMVEKMRSMGGEMQELRQEMMGKISGVLDAKQTKLLEGYLRVMRGAGGRGGERRGNRGNR